jgi:myo-inositol-1(or 4)-monophosphatase
MNDTELKELTHEVVAISKIAGQYLKGEIQKLKSADVMEKGIHNLVTYVDKSSEKMLVDALEQLLPEAGFIAEEGTATRLGQDYNWIIDPLDGTTNYIHSVPLYSVSLALKYQDEIVIGVIYEPNLDECFYTWKGGASYLNGEVIHVSATPDMNHSLFATGFPYYDYSKLAPYMDFFEHLMRYSRGIRRLGSAAVDLAYVACGRYDGFYEYGLSSWDVAAGTLIVQNAGGMNTDFNEGKNYIFGKELISVNPYIYQEFQTVFAKYFNNNESKNYSTKNYE